MRELERDPPTTTTAPQAGLPALAIVGAGRVGGSLARASKAAGLVVTLASHDEALDAVSSAEAVLLCVPDAAIAEVAASIASASPIPRLVGHTSGATGLDALAPLEDAGAALFSLHPLQTVPDGATDFTGCPCAISASDGDALDFARRLAERLAMRWFEISESDRAAYHAAAAIASNFLVALEQSATELLARLGVDDARELLAPLVLRTALNWSERGPAALTGPIARGDEATVARHLEALRRSAPELIDLYEALAERTRAIAGEGGTVRG